MKIIHLLLLCCGFATSSLFAQITFETDTVFLSNTGVAGVYEGKIAVSTSNGELADMRWEQIERNIEPLVWNAFVFTCDSMYFPFSVEGPITRQTGMSDCFIGVNITNLEGNTPQVLNQIRLRASNINSPNVFNDLSFILEPVSVNTKDLLPPATLALYPNPVDDILGITFSAGAISLPAQMQLFNSQGQLIQQRVLATSESQLSTAALASGVYFLRVDSAEGQAIQSFLKR